MPIDLFDLAQRLHVVDVWQSGNETGWVTPRCLYDPRTPVPGSNPPRYVAPNLRAYWAWIDHGTVGTNTLRFWGEGGSIQNRTFSLAHYLVPHEQTQYRDGRMHDTSYTVFKMVPDGYACNNVGDAIDPFSNHNTLSVEYESVQKSVVHDISDLQVAKGALLYAYNSHLRGIGDHLRVSHGIVGVPWGRRSDPWAGNFPYDLSWHYVYTARNDARIRQLWGWQ